MFAVFGAVAELERNLIIERVRAGLRHARAKGKAGGWDSAVFIHCYDELELLD